MLFGWGMLFGIALIIGSILVAYRVDVGSWPWEDPWA